MEELKDNQHNEKPPLNISFVYADKPGELNTSIYRCIIPYLALKNSGHHVSLIPVHLFEQNTIEANSALEKSDIIVIERNFFGDVLTRIAYWIVRGKIVIANYDDYYEGIEETNASYSFWNKGEVDIEKIDYIKELRSYVYSDKYYKFKNETVKEIREMLKKIGYPHPLWQFKMGLKMVYAQIMPSKYMMKKYKSLSPTYYIPNYFVTQNYIHIPKTPRDFKIIGWGGSLSHLQSFKDSGVIQALENIINSRNDVKLLICGDQRLLPLIKISDDKKLFQPYVKNEDWGKVISSLFDIGIAPLEGEYDKYRSIIKPIEFMLTKTPFVASYGEAYKELFQIGGLGSFIKNSAVNWEQKLLYILDNYESEKEIMNGKPFEYALTWDYMNGVDYMVETYRKIAKELGNRDL